MAHSRFNPLAGIRCFLTRSVLRWKLVLLASFNPLAGIRCFLTDVINWIKYNPISRVSIPLRGFVVF